MAKTKYVACVNYINEHNCGLGKDAVFYGLCQTCPSYRAKPGAKPAKTDTRRQKIERAERKERF